MKQKTFENFNSIYKQDTNQNFHYQQKTMLILNDQFIFKNKSEQKNYTL